MNTKHVYERYHSPAVGPVGRRGFGRGHLVQAAGQLEHFGAELLQRRHGGRRGFRVRQPQFARVQRRHFRVGRTDGRVVPVRRGRAPPTARAGRLRPAAVSVRGGGGGGIRLFCRSGVRSGTGGLPVSDDVLLNRRSTGFGATGAAVTVVNAAVPVTVVNAAAVPAVTAAAAVIDGAV